jgi:hypothetical protein
MAVLKPSHPALLYASRYAILLHYLPLSCPQVGRSFQSDMYSHGGNTESSLDSLRKLGYILQMLQLLMTPRLFSQILLGLMLNCPSYLAVRVSNLVRDL